MSQTHSVSVRRRYGIQRVCRVWHVPRSTVHAYRRRAEREPFGHTSRLEHPAHPVRRLPGSRPHRLVPQSRATVSDSREVGSGAHGSSHDDPLVQIVAHRNLPLLASLFGQTARPAAIPVARDPRAAAAPGLPPGLPCRSAPPARPDPAAPPCGKGPGSGAKARACPGASSGSAARRTEKAGGIRRSPSRHRLLDPIGQPVLV